MLAGGAYVFIAICFGLAGGIVGRLKGGSFWIWFMVAGAIPIFGLLAAIFHRDERREERRACPGCGRIVPVHDTKCMRCGTELYYPRSAEEIIPPELPAPR